MKAMVIIKFYITTIANLKSLGFFGEVNSEILEGSAENKKLLMML